jgi:hypothetical protein
MFSNSRQVVSSAAKNQSKLTTNTNSNVIFINSNSAPNWGSSIQFDIKQKRVKINEIVLAITLPPIAGISGGTGASYVPAEFLYNFIDIQINNVFVQYIYSDYNFFCNQLFNTDERRAVLNSWSSYTNTANRVTRSAALNTYYIPLRTLMNQTQMAILSNIHEVVIRVNFPPASEIVNLNGGTGSPTSGISNCQLILKVDNLTDEEFKSEFVSMSPKQLYYLDTREQKFPMASGSTQIVATLTNIRGSTPLLFFIVRLDTNQTGDNQFLNLIEIANFELKDAGGKSITNSPIASTLSLSTLSRDWAVSSFLGESLAGTYSNFIYMWSFADKTAWTMASGDPSGSYRFTGTETLTVNMKTALGASATLQVFSSFHSLLLQKPDSVIKTEQF